MSSEREWTWEFTQRASDRFESLDPHAQDRIVSKLDEIVSSEWRDPGDFLEPLTGSPFEKRSVRIASGVTSTGAAQSWRSIGSSTEAGRTRPTTTDGDGRPSPSSSHRVR